MRSRVTITVLLAVALGFALWLWMRSAPPGTATDRTSAVPTRAASGDPDSDPPLAAATDDARRATSAARDPGGATAAPISAVAVSGRTLDAAGRPVAGAQVGVASTETYPWTLSGPALATSDEAGRFTCSVPAAATLAARTDVLATLVAARVHERDDELVIVLGLRVSVGGTVVDELRVTVPGARIEFVVPNTSVAAIGRGADREGMFPNAFADSDADGRFALGTLVAVPGAFLRATRSGFDPLDVAVPEASTTTLEIVLAKSGSAGTLTGTVVDGAGAPVPDATVQLALDIVRSDLTGVFVVPAPARLRPKDRMVVRKSGYTPRLVSGAELQAARDARANVRVVLQGPTLAIEGRVTGVPDEERSRWRVSLLDPTPLIPDRASDGWVENDGRPDARVDAEGRFRLAPLDARSYDVVAFDPRSLVSARALRVPAGTSDLELRVDPDARLEIVSGRVLGLDGTGVAGVAVRHVLVTSQDATAREIMSWISGSQYLGGQSAQTGADGAFQLAGIPRGPLQFFVTGDAVIPAIATANEHGDPGALRLAVHRRRTIQVDLGATWVARTWFEVLDGAGEKLHLYSFGRNQVESSDVATMDGPISAKLAVSESARVVRVHSGSGASQEIPLTFDEQGAAIVRR